MYSTNIYLYKQLHDVLLVKPGTVSSLRNKAVYAKNLKLHKGVDNTIQIHFKNQDQKKIDITGLSFTFRLIDQKGEALLLELPLTVIDAVKGYTELTVTEQQLDIISSQHARYSIEYADSTTSQPAYVDEQAGGAGNCDVVDSAYPKHVASAVLTMQQQIGTIQKSAELVTNDQALHTFQVSIKDFNGTMKVQGAVDNTNNWYDIDTVTLVGTGAGLYDIEGFHPKLRLYFDKVVGEVEKVLVR